MKKIIIISIFLILPKLFFGATYFNNTSHPLTIHKPLDCSYSEIADHDTCVEEQCIKKETDCICTEDRSCTKSEFIQILPQESVVFENDQDQPVIIMSKDLNEKREFFPTNNSFNYEISVAKSRSKFPRLTINHAQ